MEIEPIAYIENDYKEKFGIPRQSGLVNLTSKIVFVPKYSDENALRGLEEFTHIWLIWGFSEVKGGFSPTVRPPRLGGNIRKGVFATRSPYRPNPLGLSVVRLERIERGVITVLGADIMNGTPIYDIKPYLPYADSHPEASEGFAHPVRDAALHVNIPAEWLDKIPMERQEALRGVLAHDPRPSYQNDPTRIYGMAFAGLEIKFRVDGDTLTVCGVCAQT